MLNSPNNPTGWTATLAILDLCRTHGVWLIADEVYTRLVYDGSEAAPSLLDAADRVIECNSFSKTYAMTGWRLGWMVLPTVGGLRDSLALALSLVHEHGVALAPGSAFGEAGEGSLRLCFAQAPERIERAMHRLRAGLQAR